MFQADGFKVFSHLLTICSLRWFWKQKRTRCNHSLLNQPKHQVDVTEVLRPPKRIEQRFKLVITANEFIPLTCWKASWDPAEACIHCRAARSLWAEWLTGSQETGVLFKRRNPICCIEDVAELKMASPNLACISWQRPCIITILWQVHNVLLTSKLFLFGAASLMVKAGLWQVVTPIHMRGHFTTPWDQWQRHDLQLFPHNQPT